MKPRSSSRFVEDRLEEGLLLFGANRTDEAIARWRSILEVYPGEPRALDYLLSSGQTPTLREMGVEPAARRAEPEPTFWPGPIARPSRPDGVFDVAVPARLPASSSGFEAIPEPPPPVTILLPPRRRPGGLLELWPYTILPLLVVVVSVIALGVWRLGVLEDARERDHRPRIERQTDNIEPSRTP